MSYQDSLEQSRERCSRLFNANRDHEAEQWAREWVEKVGYEAALSLAEQYRDTNAPGTFSFAHWNRIYKALRLFATCGKVS